MRKCLKLSILVQFLSALGVLAGKQLFIHPWMVMTISSGYLVAMTLGAEEMIDVRPDVAHIGQVNVVVKMMILIMMMKLVMMVVMVMIKP